MSKRQPRRYNRITAENIRVLIADDHTVLRAGLRILIEAESDMTVVGEAGSITETIQKAIKLLPDLLILDLTMGEQNALTIIPHIKKEASPIQVLVLTMHEDPLYYQSALNAGASGYVVKKAADTELIAAIRKVHSGGVFMNLAVDRPREDQKQEDLAGMPPTKLTDEMQECLSPRERDVLSFVAMGYTNRQIAEQFALSIKSIESYRARLMQKLGIKNRAELVRVAINFGLLEDQSDTGKISEYD